MNADIDPVICEIELVEEAFLEVVETIRRKKNLLLKLKSQKEEDEAASPKAAAFLPREAEAVARLRQLVQQQLPELKKSCNAELDQLVGCNYKMDLPRLSPFGIYSVIRSFRAVSPETLLSAFQAFTERGEREAFRVCLCLCARADVDGLVDGVTVLMRAVCNGHFDSVRMLVERGAGLEVKCTNGYRGLTPGSTVLHMTFFTNSPEIANFLLSSGANVSAVDDEGAIAELLLDHGAQVNEAGEDGVTPLLYTVLTLTFRSSYEITDRRDIAELLLSRGADVKATDKVGRSVLHFAAFCGSTGVAELVLGAGADVNATTDLGETALHFVAGHQENMDEIGIDPQKQLRVAQMLVRHGANASLMNNQGMTALDYAERWVPEDSPVRTFLAGL
uniref:Uncharacterized protein n=1 Tax=Chromera velia CCMP2878 TaxID=1169474 RepID=A0A0G4HPV3_9ALVE|eukprot:Cvel_30067.t1-p1 / transcript=Cvel_30067.t1 / gene=Cvel_30067 / organism=Chromera_velia_CCMP2878 / gene_product=Putative ankyrin repeat protein RF_0381, putative / transcript_product=Putative ankyrin repeat protein RF_0381, putative / location=Cvel_scaffold4231:1537-2844(-) / protein_length=390 / sequence_SO=supercontig / SO=protein_coding / is_pseudo=false